METLQRKPLVPLTPKQRGMIGAKRAAESVEAQNVVVVDDDEDKAKTVRCMCYWALALFIVLGTVIGLSIGLTRKNESAITISEFPSASPTLVPTGTMVPTLETIQNNGKIRCGIGYFDDIETDLVRTVFFPLFS